MKWAGERKSGCAFLVESFVCLFFTFASYCCRELGQRTELRLGQGDEGDNNGDYLDDDEHDGQHKHHGEDALDIHLRHVDLAIKTLVTTVIKFYDKTTRTAPAKRERKTLTHCPKKKKKTTHYAQRTARRVDTARCVCVVYGATSALSHYCLTVEIPPCIVLGTQSNQLITHNPHTRWIGSIRGQ